MPPTTPAVLTELAVIAFIEGYCDNATTSGESLIPFMEKWLDSGTRSTLLKEQLLDEEEEAKHIREVLFSQCPPDMVEEVQVWMLARALGKLADSVQGTSDA